MNTTIQMYIRNMIYSTLYRVIYTRARGVIFNPLGASMIYEVEYNYLIQLSQRNVENL